MSTREEEFLKRLQAAYVAEAQEHVQAMSSGLLALEKAPDAEEQAGIVETVFREAHSLKGASRAVNRTDIETICQSLETVFAALKRQEMSLSPALFDMLHDAVDAVDNFLSSSESGSPADKQKISRIVQQLARAKTGMAGDTGSRQKSAVGDEESPGDAPTPAPPVPPPPTTTSAPTVSTTPVVTPAVPATPIGSQKAASNGQGPSDDASGTTEEITRAQPAAAQLAAAQPAPAQPDPMQSPAPLASTARPAVEARSEVVDAPRVDAPRDGHLPAQDRAIQDRAAQEKPVLSETVRISTGKLDAMLLQAEEMLAIKLTAGQRAAELHAVKGILELWRKEWGRIDTDMRRLRSEVGAESSRGGESSRHDGNGTALATATTSTTTASASHKVLEFLDWNRDYVKSLEARLTQLSRSAERDQRAVGAMVDNLLDDMKKLLMLPFSMLLGVFPKMVRDLSRDQGKDVQLVMRGSEVEIDKRILDEMKDPLIHLLRNSVDHGIERAEERVRHNKPARATVTISVTQLGGKVEILISDDGGGIHLERVKAAAVKHGIITEDKAATLTDQQAMALIFQSDVSTSPIITEISGRGLGMAIVREKVEKLGGQIGVETALGKGTSFRIMLPLTMATFRGILVRCANQIFVVPIANVERVVRIKEDDIETVENRETIRLHQSLSEQDIVSLVRLDDVLELQRPESEKRNSDFIPVMVLSAMGQRIAFRMDEILNEQEVLVKSLGKPLARVRNVAGATVLGSGKAVPILNVEDLMKSAVKVSGAGRRSSGGEGKAEEETQSVLIAEDSITSRMLLKNILESAGYEVTTAVDGVDALTALKSNDFDLVVSDVDMPRMSGFDLTAKIRGDEQLAHLPVVLVTARDTPEDRERGVDVGANAYIVKSSFDQSNLLEVVRRLV